MKGLLLIGEIDTTALLIVAIPAMFTVLTSIFAYIQGTKSTKVDAYKAMAERVAVVEARADNVNALVIQVAKLQANLTILNSWAAEATKWMSVAQDHLRADSDLPLPPLPPPDLIDISEGAYSEFGGQ